MTTDIEERLLALDREIHAILHDLHFQHSASMSIDELAERMQRDRISEEDSTELIRRMRDRPTDA